MPTIEVDFDVFKALTARRPTEEVIENDVLRQLLRLPPRSSPDATSEAPAPDDWVTKGVRLPAGTELRARYKGQTYLARVASAALKITQHPVNGWTFWECRLPGQGKWASMKELRRGR